MKALLKIVFVCTGNTCRSPMAELIAKATLKERKIKGVSVSSRGISVTENRINPSAERALEYKGVEIGKFRPKKITKTIAKSCDAFITMTDAMKNILTEKGFDNVYSARELVGYEITDPYGKDFAFYAACEREIETFVSEVVGMIEKILIEKRR